MLSLVLIQITPNGALRTITFTAMIFIEAVLLTMKKHTITFTRLFGVTPVIFFCAQCYRRTESEARRTGDQNTFHKNVVIVLIGLWLKFGG